MATAVAKAIGSKAKSNLFESICVNLGENVNKVFRKMHAVPVSCTSGNSASGFVPDYNETVAGPVLAGGESVFRRLLFTAAVTAAVGPASVSERRASADRSPPPTVCGSPAPVPPSPMKAFIRAYLPNQQRTSVTVRHGVTVREALSKAMSLRKLTPETCVVYKCSKQQVSAVGISNGIGRGSVR